MWQIGQALLLHDPARFLVRETTVRLCKYTTCEPNWPWFSLALQKNNWLYLISLSFITATHIQQNLIYCRDDSLVSWVCCELVDELRWGDQLIPSTWDLLHLHHVHSPLWKSGPAWHAQGHLGSVWQWQEPNLIYLSVQGYCPAPAPVSVLRMTSWPEMEKKCVLIYLFISVESKTYLACV